MNNDKPDQSGQRSAPVTEPSRPSNPGRANPAYANPTYANVDRLIELASDKTPAAPTAKDDPVKENSGNSGPKTSEDKSMWKILLQLKPLLPYLARLVPLLDVAVGPMQNAGLSKEVREAVTQTTAKIQAIQDDVSAAVQEQALQLKRLEEALTRLRDASEKNAAAQDSFAQDLASILKLVALSAAGLGILLIALIVMTAVLLAHLLH
jgi:hypothetical protein